MCDADTFVAALALPLAIVGGFVAGQLIKHAWMIRHHRSPSGE